MPDKSLMSCRSLSKRDSISPMFRASFHSLSALTAVTTLAMLAGCVAAKPHWNPENVAAPTTSGGAFEAAPALDARAEPIAPATSAAEAVKLTRDGALATALQHNIGIEVAKFGPRIGETYEPEARAAFDPTLAATLSYGHAATASTTAGVLGVLKTNSTDSSMTLNEVLPTGTRLFLTGDMALSDTNANTDRHQGDASIGIEQPLLKGAGMATNLVALRQARNKAAKSEHVFRASIISLVSNVENGYWELSLAEEILSIRQFALKLAEEQFQRAESLLAVGKAIEGDVASARAERASRQAALTDAEASIRTKTLALVRLLNPGGEQAWNLAFDTVDAPEALKVDISPDESEKLAVAYRPELAQSRLEAANADLDVVSAKNDRLPTVNLVGQYGRISTGTGPGDAINHFGDTPYHSYEIGLSVETPILNRAENARYRRSMLTAEQASRSVANVEQGIAAEVRQAAVEVERQWNNIPATQEAVRSRDEELRVAQGRYGSGQTTELDLMIAQRDLIEARIEEVQARVAYIEALTGLFAAEGTLLERRGISLATEASHS